MTTQNQFVNSHFLRDLFKRVLPNSQAVALAIILIVSFVLIYSLSDLLMPVFVSIVLAYLLEGLISKAESMRMPRLPAVYLVFSVFMACLVFLLFYLLPLVSQQAVELVQQIPEILNRAQTGIMSLPKMYPQFISESKIQQ
ncbi:MAG: AI-2E family transporter, partial [Methylobacter sp.]